MENVIPGHFTLTDEQRRFKEQLSKYPRLAPYWNFEQRECDLHRLEKDLNVLSTSESIMARFFCAVWLGEDRLKFDLTDAATSLNQEDQQVINSWLSEPDYR